MKVEKYYLKFNETITVFEFTSEGPKGTIHKLIHFQPTYLDGVYNLAFGDKNIETGDMDDLAVSNNGEFRLHLMKAIQELNKNKTINGTIDSTLNKYLNKTPFPQKLEKANEMLKGAKLPSKKQVH